MSEKPLILDYHGIPGKPRRPAYWRYCFWAAIYTVFFAAALLFGIPKFKEIFRDFGTTLPVLTTYIIAFSDFAIHGGWIIILPIPFLLPLPLLIAHSMIADLNQAKLFRRIYSLILFMLLLLWMVFLIQSIALPLLKLMGSLTGGGP